jgi:glycosyltransferase involved in cell wall biosynthesis
MILQNLRIGYVPATSDLSAPSDRRRFCYYARKRNLRFEIAEPSKTYDLVVLNQRADLSIWHNYRKGNAKIVYDAIDSYLAVRSGDVKGKLRGWSKFLTRQSRYPQLDYRRAVQQMCRRADAVVCSTEEQKKLILPFCGNVHRILDFQAGDITRIKTDYACGEVFSFVWEGLASSGIPMDMLREILEPIRHRRKIALHLVTDLTYFRFHDLYVKCNTVDQVHRTFNGFANKVYLYQWNAHMLSQIVCACDLALIPIPLDDAFRTGKPENKLILFWRMGIPVVTSATPAYERVMQQCGLSMACKNPQDWQETIGRYMNDDGMRRYAGQIGRRFAEDYYSEEKILRRWDDVFSSL